MSEEDLPLLEEEQLGLFRPTEPLPEQAWDDVVAPPPAPDVHDMLWLAPEEIRAFYSFAAPLLAPAAKELPEFQSVGAPLVGACPFDQCPGRLYVNPDCGYFEVRDGCGRRGSIYGFLMRLHGVEFWQARASITRWVVDQRLHPQYEQSSKSGRKRA